MSHPWDSIMDISLTEETKKYVVGRFTYCTHNMCFDMAATSQYDTWLVRCNITNKLQLIVRQCLSNDCQNKTVAICDIPHEVVCCMIRSRCFSLAIDQVADTIFVCLNERAFVELEDASNPVIFPPKCDVRKVLCHFGCSLFNDLHDEQPKVDGVEDLLKNLCNSREVLTSVTFKHNLKGFLPELRNYQKAAVNWMLQREQAVVDAPSQLHSLFAEYQTMDGELIYAQKYDGFFTKQRFCRANQLPGGILAEEMGLGKTVEILALILLNPQPSDCITEIAEQQVPISANVQLSNPQATSPVPIKRGCKKFIVSHNFLCMCGKIKSSKALVTCSRCDISHHLACMFSNPDVVNLDPYICSFCMVKETKMSRATLIVSPATISDQWYSEIQCNTKPGTLKVYCYKGVNKEKFVTPSFLADQDVVIVTHKTLCSEVRYVGRECNIRSDRRHCQKYVTLPSPLTAVNWWRICLDEAQKTEFSSSNFVKMAQQLKCRNRWCVTGMPIQKSVLDLYGIFQFLEYDPYNVKEWFYQLLYDPSTFPNYHPILKVLIPILWRSSKEDVADQIDLSPQTVVYHDLTFSPVESYFYKRQHDYCTIDFLRQVETMDPSITLEAVDTAVRSRIIAPLFQLRKACCHPQIIKGEFEAYNGKVMTMEEVSIALMNKAKTACKAMYNMYLSSVNGIAGLQLLEKNFSDAIENYDHVLEFVAKEKKHFMSDRFQELHALHNLAEVLKGFDVKSNKSPSFPLSILLSPDAYIEILEQRKKVLCTLYFHKHETLLQKAQRTCDLSVVIANEWMQIVESEEMNNNNSWWRHIFNDVEKSGKEESFVKTVKKMLATIMTLYHVTTLRDLSCFCEVTFRKLQICRKTLIECIKDLSKSPTNEDVSLATECHLRPTGTRKLCKFCLSESVFDDYETRLFHETDVRASRKEQQHLKMSDDIKYAEEALKKHKSWDNGLLEETFNSIMDSGKLYHCSSSKQSRRTMDLFDCLRSEYRALRTLWLTARTFVSAMDELNVAKTRVRLQDEHAKNLSDTLSVAPSMLPARKQILMQQKSTSYSEFQTASGRLLFLQTITKDYDNKNEQESDLCPICFESVAVAFKVLVCGHRVCYTCVNTLITAQQGMACYHSLEVRCPICRHPSRRSEICQGGNSVYFKTKDNYSTKVQGAMESLLKIQEDDPGAKTIVFTCFGEMVCVLEEALKQNNISFVNLVKGPKFEENLEKFKHDATHNVLLFNVKSGANGLNIIEASHLFLMEPWLNPGNTALAVSRIHRIGQQKRTTVHHFYVKETIEEAIVHSLKKEYPKRKYDDETSFTIEYIKEMFSKYT